MWILSCFYVCGRFCWWGCYVNVLRQTEQLYNFNAQNPNGHYRALAGKAARSLLHGNLRGPSPPAGNKALGMMVSNHDNCYEVQFLFERLSPGFKQLPTIYKAKLDKNLLFFWDDSDGILPRVFFRYSFVVYSLLGTPSSKEFPGGWFSQTTSWPPKNGIFVSDFVNLATKF